MDLTKAAKEFMIAYFSDGERHTPSDFDEDILGGTDLDFIAGISYRPRWNSTPFFDALAELVKEGLVEFEKVDGSYYYFKKP